MSDIYDVEGKLGEQLFAVIDKVDEAVVMMEEIPQEDWSDDMDRLHRKLKHWRILWLWVELKGGEE